MDCIHCKLTVPLQPAMKRLQHLIIRVILSQDQNAKHLVPELVDQDERQGFPPLNLLTIDEQGL
jgi:hypothetical protein